MPAVPGACPQAAPSVCRPFTGPGAPLRPSPRRLRGWVKWLKRGVRSSRDKAQGVAVAAERWRPAVPGRRCWVSFLSDRSRTGPPSCACTPTAAGPSSWSSLLTPRDERAIVKSPQRQRAPPLLRGRWDQTTPSQVSCSGTGDSTQPGPTCAGRFALI